MNRIVTRLAVLAIVGATAGIASAEPTAGTPAPAPRAQRIVIVNIAQVLRDYDKANFKGAEITKLRQDYVTQVNALREQVATLNARFQMTQLPDEKKKLEEQARAIQRKVEDIDREAQARLTKLSNDTVVQVYQEIKGVIADIAKTNNLDMVLAYPAASKAEDDATPAVATLMLQTPALMPFYHRGMDISKVVIETLNARYPSPKAPPIQPVSGTEAAPPRNPGPMAPAPGGR